MARRCSGCEELSKDKSERHYCKECSLEVWICRICKDARWNWQETAEEICEECSEALYESAKGL